MKQLLIITGPQGSGNHLWSKIFAESPLAYGWSDLRETYWIPHDQEPFAEAWHDPTKLSSILIDKDYAVTSISCPYAYKGQPVDPNYKGFINKAEELGYQTKIAIIGRDQNVIKFQQQRVRKEQTIDRFNSYLPYLFSRNPFFLSTELLYLYGDLYLKSLQNTLNFPIHVKGQKLKEILKQDPNTKYFQPAESQELDGYVRHVSGIK